MVILVKNASSMCNLECSYCFYRDEAEHRAEPSRGFMTCETASLLITQALKHAKDCCTFIFQGGEPTLSGIDFFRYFVNTIKEENKNRIDVRYFIQTNGQLINQEWAKFFYENNFLVGVSLDGRCDLHDRCRGNGTHRKVMKAIDVLKRNNVDVNVLAVVTSRMTKNAEAVYDFFKKNNLYFQQYIPCFDSIDGKSNLQPEEFGRFLIRLFRLWAKDARSSRPVSIRFFDELILRILGNNGVSCSTCGVCGIQYAVESDGDVYPCDFYCIDDYLLGNINVDDFQKIDMTRSKIRFIETSETVHDECINCRYYRLCRGGCRRDRDHFNGLTTEKNRLCEGYKMFFEECGEEIISLAQFFSAGAKR